MLGSLSSTRQVTTRPTNHNKGECNEKALHDLHRFVFDVRRLHVRARIVRRLGAPIKAALLIEHFANDVVCDSSEECGVRIDSVVSQSCALFERNGKDVLDSVVPVDRIEEASKISGSVRTNCTHQWKIGFINSGHSLAFSLLEGITTLGVIS